MRKHASKENGDTELECQGNGSHARNGPLIEHDALFEGAAKRYKPTEHHETANSVNRVHHNPSIAKHRHRDSQHPYALDS